MKKYKFTKKYNFWKAEHIANFMAIKNYYDSHYELVKQEASDHLSFLEIGVFEGRSSTWLIDNILENPVKGKPGILHCIDPELTKNGLYNLAQHQGSVTFYAEPSHKALIRFVHEGIQRFDFIYVDGDHNACGLLEDLVLSWKLLRINGLMLIDDYEMETTDPWHYVSHKEFDVKNPRLRFTHPRIAIDAFLSIYRGQYTMQIDGYQICIKKVIEILP